MSKPHIIALGKVVRFVARLRGGGSALPGLVIEKIDPSFVRDSLAQLPHGVVVISGTNGKTTTTKIVVELLESQGFTVFTNRTGSNFVRGVIAAILGDINLKGQLEADIAVLELDEAHAVKFVDIVPPRYSLLLNVMRDQLDRFGEIDTTTAMLRHIAKATTDTVVLNREDERIAKLQTDIAQPTTVRYFGLSPSLRRHFPSDDNLKEQQNTTTPTAIPADVTLSAFKQTDAIFIIDGQSQSTTLKLNGVYNTFNAAAALALVRAIAEGTSTATPQALLDALSHVTPAFGRGEALVINGQPLELLLVKNPSGFRLALQSFAPNHYATMIAINDNYADGRDMSWLWDVDFSSLKANGVHTVSGLRAYDMALRLQYDQVDMVAVEPSLAVALDTFLTSASDTPKRIYCSYTAMLSLRKLLSRKTTVEKIS